MPSKSRKSRANRPVKLEAPPTLNGATPASQAETDLRTGDTTESAGEPIATAAVNRKKQKRREKDTAKRPIDQQLPNGYPADSVNHMEQVSAVRQGRGPAKGYFTEEPDFVDDGFHDDLAEPDDAFYTGDEDGNYTHEFAEETTDAWLNASKRKKGSKTRLSDSHQHHGTSRVSSGMPRSTLPALSNAAIRSAHKMSNDQIWNTSTQAERENIKLFWLELGEEERRSLVKVEKEAVLKKMKEQQKHSCSCSVCGRKRTAIEEELEVLYDAYYEELEQFANHNNEMPNGPQVMPPPRSYRPLQGQAHPMVGSYPVSGRIRELGDDGEEIEDDEEEDYEDDEDDEPFSDEDYDDELPPGPPDFFQFGNSLTVKDGILTVADDLLKNDGKHFIDMMEQLAERRMQREEEIHYPAPPLAHQGLRQGHNHPPIDDEEDDDYDDDEDEEDYDSQDEDEFEGDEMDSMTEEQRMEEGRRMFQIFAARMFEQRVLTAYREKVAAERQRKLLEELDEESRLDTQREAKKARDAAKKKEKKARQKAAKEEEKAKKDAEKAAQEAAVKAAVEKKAEEQRKKKEEQRRKKEAERKAVEEEKQRKEAEKQRRALEERERQADQDRKQREAKEREKKKREDARKKEKEEREVREREIKEKRQQEEHERKAQEELLRKQRDESQRIDKDVKSKQDQAPKSQPVALPPGLHPVQRGIQSPLAQVATPILPSGIQAPARNRQTSQPSQPSHASSPKSQQASTDTSQPSLSPTNAILPSVPAVTQVAKPHGPITPMHHQQTSASRAQPNNTGRGGQYPYQVNGTQGLGMMGPPSGPGMVPGAVNHLPPYPGPPLPPQQRFVPHNTNIPPGFNGPRHFPPGQPIPYAPQQTNVGISQAPQSQAIQPPIHTRQQSGSDSAHHQQGPISRPGPIARPSSTTPDKQRPGDQHADGEVDQLATQLGSKALLDDSDEPMPTQIENRPGFPPVGPPGSGRTPFVNQFHEPKHNNFSMASPVWNGFSGSTGPGWSGPPARSGQGWPQQFGAIGNVPPVGRTHAPRPIAVRLMLVNACRRLSSMSGNQTKGFHPVAAILQQLEHLAPPGEPAVSMDEMLAICDTEGNVQNGGGSFEVVRDGTGHQLVKYVEDVLPGALRATAGDIGSPMQPQGSVTPFGSVGQGFGPPGRHF